MSRFVKTPKLVLVFVFYILFSASPADALTITNAVLGGGVILGAGTYDDGTDVTLIAVPQVDWVFDHWDGVSTNFAFDRKLKIANSNSVQPKAVFIKSKGSGRFSSGTVSSWGAGIAKPPENLKNIVSIAAGNSHVLATSSDGTVVSWGYNDKGQTNVPLGLKNVVRIAAGGHHSLAIDSSGKITTWGWGQFGQTNPPPGIGVALGISAGIASSFAWNSDGKVFGWGDNSLGQINIPKGLSNIISISTSYHHSLALRSDGKVFSWGNNSAGQVDIPKNIHQIVSVSAGQGHSLALTKNGEVIGWGSNANGELLIPPDLNDVVRIIAGNCFSIALRSNGSVVSWGYFGGGAAKVPQSVSNIVDIFVAENNGFALISDHVSVINEPALETVVEEGEEIVLSSYIAGADKWQWYKNGFPIDRQSSPWLRLADSKLSDSAVYFLVATSATEGVVTVPSVVKVLPKGAPRISVNGCEVIKSIRVGDVAEVSAVTSFDEGQLFYTLDGSIPSVDSTRYIGSFSVYKDCVLRFISINSELTREVISDSFQCQVAPAFALVKSIAGDGKVIENPKKERYLQDDVVFVQATPSEGWRFVRWQGDIDGSFPERNIVMVRNKLIKAIFEPIPRYSVGVISNGGNVSGAGIYYQGSTVNLVAQPLPEWSFIEWAGGGGSSEANINYRVDKSVVLEAVFGTEVAVLSTGLGRVVLNPYLKIYPYGSQIKVVPVPEAGNCLALWGGAGAGQPRSEWVLTVTNGAPRVTALFRPLSTDKVVLTAQSTFGGRISQPTADGVYAKGASVSVTAVPDSGYEFTGWSGDASGLVNPLTLTLDASKNVRAEFRRTGVVSYPATITVNGPGTVRRVPDLGEYESGMEVEFVAEPSAGAVFSGWQGSVNSSQKRIRVTFNGPIQVTAGFKSLYPVATEARGEGQILLSPPDANYVEGTSVALTAKPGEGWGFVQWSGDLVTTAQESALTVDAPKRVVAEFARLGTLTLKNIGQGTVSKVPEGSSFLPGTSVRLNATPAPGWKFIRWSGGATGTNPELAVVVGRTEAIVAEFADGEAPRVTLTEPVAGNVRDERFTLKGSASDNLRLASVSWTWNGVPQGAVPMGDGVFNIEGLTLQPGTNQIVLDAVDAVGNATRVERMVVWTPVRSLLVKTAPEVQEGQRLVFPVTLDSPGDVAGLTFQLSYDPVWLADPQWEWGALVGQSVNTLNTATNGQVWATFSMPGQTLPSGVQSIANVSFRARSVPEVRVVDLKPSIRSVSGLQGDALSPGNVALAGQGRIKSRRIKADNNANQRLDIGDAVVVARLQVGLDEARAWDVTLNDLNASGSLDNGDVVKVLRAVVGLDVQPGPGSEGKRFAAALGLAKALVNTNDVMALELIDGPIATVGQPYRVAVRLNRVTGSLSGLSFTVKYPASLGLTDKQVGALVPGDALPFWNEGAGQVSLAAIRSTAWVNATGVAAVLTFVPSAAFSGQAEWLLRLEQSEITGSGFDVRPVDPVTVVIQSSGGTVDNRPQITLQPPKADGTLGLEIRATQGATLAIETTSDLSTWAETQRVTGQGNGTPVKLTLQPDPNVQTKFWRVRVR